MTDLSKSHVKQVMEMLHRHQRLTAIIEQREAELKELKTELRALAENDIAEACLPEWLDRAFVLEDGTKVELEREYHVSVKKDRQTEVMAWLDEQKLSQVQRHRVIFTFGVNQHNAAMSFVKLLERIKPDLMMHISMPPEDEVILKGVQETARAIFPEVEIEYERAVHGSTMRSLIIKRFKMGLPIHEGVTFHCPLKPTITRPEGVPESPFATPIQQLPREDIPTINPARAETIGDPYGQ